MRAFVANRIFVANTRLFGLVLSRLLLRHLGFDSDFAQISEQKTGGWGLCMGQFAMEWSQDCDKNVPSYRGKAGVDLILPDRPQAAPSLLSYLSTLSGCKWDINDVISMAMLAYSAVTLGWLKGNSRGNQSTSGKVGILPNHWRKNWTLYRARWACPRLKRWALPQMSVPSPSAPPESKSLSWLLKLECFKNPTSILA